MSVYFTSILFIFLKPYKDLTVPFPLKNNVKLKTA